MRNSTSFIEHALGWAAIACGFAVGTYLGFVLFNGKPTGHYHIVTDGVVASVYEDRQFLPDARIFRGNLMDAWRLYAMLTEAQGVQYRTANP